MHNLFRHFADRIKEVHDVNDLELALFGCLDRLLTRDHD